MNQARGPRPAERGDAGLLDLEAYATAKTKGGNGNSSSSSSGNQHLAALIQGLGAASLGSAGGGNLAPTSSSSSSSKTIVSFPRELFRHEMAGGLKVDYAYMRGEDVTPSLSSSSSPSPTCTLLMTLTNTRDSPMRRIRIVTASPSDYARLLPFPEIPMLDAGTAVEVRLGLDFKVRGRSRLYG